MRFVTSSAVFLAVTLLGIDLVTQGQPTAAAGGYAAAVLVAALIAGVVHRLLPGRHHGTLEGDCVRCRGEGQAFYGSGRATYRRRCRTCHGSGAARDARRVSRALRQGGIIVPAAGPTDRGSTDASLTDAG